MIKRSVTTCLAALLAAACLGGSALAADPPKGPGGPIAAPCLVPDVRGKSVRIARQILQIRGCKLGRIVKVPSKRSDLGHVIAQSIAPGRVVSSGRPINLMIGLGRR